MTGPSARVVACPPAPLEQLVRSLFIAAGASRDNAPIVAGHLVLANLSGVDTHGVIHVPGYLDAIREGRIDPLAQPTVDRDAISSARVRGHWGFGHVAGLRATETGIAKALEAGIATIAVVECGHVGRVGHYAELGADADETPRPSHSAVASRCCIRIPSRAPFPAAWSLAQRSTSRRPPSRA